MSVATYLYNLAAARALYQPQLDALEAERVALMTRIAETKRALDDAERQTREYLLAHVQATGDLTPHPAVQVRRVSKWAYDKDAMLALAIKHDAEYLIRVKRELNVREFERQLAQGFIKWADAELVNEIVIAIDTRLGDLLMEGGAR